MPVNQKKLEVALHRTQNPEYPEIDLICEECFEKYTTTYKNSKLCRECYFGDEATDYWEAEPYDYWN